MTPGNAHSTSTTAADSYFHVNNWVNSSGVTKPQNGQAMKIQVYFTAQSAVTPQVIAAKKTLQECPHIEIIQMGIASAGLRGEIEQNRNELLDRVSKSPMAPNNHVVVTMNSKQGEIAATAIENRMHLLEVASHEESADELVTRVLEHARPDGLV